MDERPTSVAANVALGILSGPDTGQTVKLRQFPCVIGRGGRSTIVVGDPDDPPGISREHAVVTIRGTVLVLTDRSLNGTRVGDRWLSRGETAELAPGMEVQLGPTLKLQVVTGTATVSSGEGSSSAGDHLAARFWAQSSPGVAASTGPLRNAPSPDPIPVHRLREFLTSPETLQAAWRRVELNRGAAGPDNVSILDYSRDAGHRLADLRKRLLKNCYQPLAPRLFASPKREGGVRTIAILAIDDRIVQNALHMALQPQIEPILAPCAYAYRPGVSAHHALRSVDALLHEGRRWVAESDIAAFFDNISHSILLDKLSGIVDDPFTLTLVDRCLACGSTSPGCGIAQGAATSPLLSNLYLTEFDFHMLNGGFSPVRFGDDVLFPSVGREQAWAALAECEGYLRSRLGLSLKAEKTRIAHVAQGFTFLGFAFSENGRKPSPLSRQKLAERLSQVSPGEAQAVERGWRNYFGEAMASDQPQGQPSGPVGTHSPALDCPCVSMVDEEALERFVALFGGRQDVHGTEQVADKRRRVVPCTGSITPELARAHLAGDRVLAAFLLLENGTVQTVALDIDRTPGQGRQAGDGRECLADFARRLARMASTTGVPLLLEDSGGRGIHAWIPFSMPAPADDARRLGRLLASAAGFPMPGLRLEVLPRHTEWTGPELGDALKLPLGVHPVTGRRSVLLDCDAEPLTSPWDVLERMHPLPASAVGSIISALSRLSRAPAEMPNPLQQPDTIQRLLSRCSVIRGLVEKARVAGHLRHTHRLILLYTAGRLGPEGAAFLHRTISLCHNYSFDICQRHLDQLDTAHIPISCRRIREWLEEEDELGLCTCSVMPKSPVEPMAWTMNSTSAELHTCEDTGAGKAEQDLDCSAQGGARLRLHEARGRCMPIKKAEPVSPESWEGIASDLFEDGEQGSDA